MNFSTLKEGWIRVKIAGCGLCHTDLGFIYTDVETRQPLPLVLGHEISGTVEIGPNVGQQVIIPAVIPCETCPACLAGQKRICSKQIMPGNDMAGGFSEYIDVPERALVPIPKKMDQESLARLSVVADAITTPLQAIHNLGLKSGELAIIIGCGGVGSFAALLAKAYGAHVIALDIDDRKLSKLKSIGIDYTFNTKDMDTRAIKKMIKELCKEQSYPRFGHKIFETSGSKPGQELAFALMGFGARIGIVGFTMSKLEVRLSNLMAFDAQLIGNWGASPDVYPEAIDFVLNGDLHLDEFTELFPLSEINNVIQKVHHDGHDRRAVLVP